ncbi:selenide, water dikinase SelD [Yaniella halotolerans]|uniref:selenide, water dikinase SelD n=1 Tax=Yaniella halotolerans TaxID=225453 RepID=UPI0003B5A9DE|nr:selenide, water dikinase SelD [Yaniella halotolerans]
MSEILEQASVPRLTTTASGGGCACKIPPGELEGAVAQLAGQDYGNVLVGVDDGDDAAAVHLDGDTAILSTADFFTPVVDSAYDWGRIAAANAISDIYAMGGQPIVAINLMGWPRGVLPAEMMSEVLAGGLAIGREAGCPVIGGHTVDDPEPKYGMAVTGTAKVDQLLRNDTAEAGLPLTLTKPIGLGLLNNRHKATGEVFQAAIDTMTTLNKAAAEQSVVAGLKAATDVTGFGLLGHLYKMMRASHVGAVVDKAAVPLVDGAAEALRDGFISGGTRRNLDWVAPHIETGSGLTEEDLLVLADAQTSGGLLVVGELPGHPVIGYTTDRAGVVEVR